MPTFWDQRNSMPRAFQASAGAALAAAGEALIGALQQYKKTSDMTANWTGAASKQHDDRTARLADAASRVIKAMAFAGTVTNTGGTQMQMLKSQNDATVASALSQQYLVLPTGQVVPGPAHYAKSSGPHGAALMKIFWMIARMYSAQVNANVAQSSMTDAQVAATLAVVALEYFADLMSEKDKAAAMAGLPGTQPFTPGLGAGVEHGPAAPIHTPNFPSGTQLAGAGSLSGAGGLPGLGGIGALGGGGTAMTGFAGLRGGGMDGSAPMTTGLMGVAGSAGAAGVSGAGAGTAAGGRGIAATGGVMPMGAAAGRAQDDEKAQAETWLHENGDAFLPDEDAPGAVLS